MPFRRRVSIFVISIEIFRAILVKDKVQQSNYLKQIYRFALRALIPAVLIFASLPADAQFYYGIRQDFGKNRVQFNDFDWVFLRFEAFDVYFYRGNEALAQNVARLTHKNLPQIENYLDAPLDERIQILVFNNLSDLKQSNVNSSEEDDYNTGGVTRISGRRLFVYFDGNYAHLEETLRMGLSEVVLSNLIYGSFTQSITNSALLNLPAWYMEGLISFVGDEWNSEVDVQVRDGFFSKKYKRINTLTQLDARYAGHSFWYFVKETYGEKVIRNIVYMSVVNRDIESGFVYILGKDMEAMTKDWKQFYKDRYGFTDDQDFEDDSALIKGRKNHEITEVELSKDGRYIAYVDRRFSRYKVYIYDRQEDKKKRIYKGGYRIAQNTDYSYPLLAWHPNGEMLSIFTEEKGITQFSIYNLESDELVTKPFYRFDKIVSLEYSPDGKQFLFSAVKDGQSDIYVYTILNTKITPITRDIYDDIDPTFFANGKRIAWSSNRPSDSILPDDQRFIRTNDLDLFATENRDLGQDSIKVWQMTKTKGVDERGLQELIPGILSFTSDRNGIRRQNLVKIDSAIAYVDTTTHYDYFFSEYEFSSKPSSIVDVDMSPAEGLRASVYLQDKRYRVYVEEYPDPRKLGLAPLQVESRSIVEAGAARDSGAAGSEAASPIQEYYGSVPRRYLDVNILNYKFYEEAKPEESKQTENEEGLKQVPLLPASLAETEAKAEDEFEIPPTRNYFLSFFQDNFTVRFDNMFDNPQYQPFTGFVSGDILNQGFNMNFKVGVMDLMHDYRIIAGLRTTFQPLPGTSLTPNAEFVIGVADFKNRWDKFYTYTRRSQVQFLALNNFRRLINNEFNYKVVFPFNPVSGIRMSVGYRIDENIRLASDFNNLDEPITYTDYAIARTSYVYDNSRKIGLNLYAGLRYKLFAEYYRNLTKSESGLWTTGIDARHYTIIHRNMIWANRLAAGTSFGPEKLIHIMGGVDNEFSPRLDQSTPIATENNYIFQTLVTNMRGFFQNVRNGNSFAVLNSELRWPFVSYLANRPIRNDFLNNLMVIGFTDIGTAWNGPDPWDPENAINTRTVPLGSGGTIVLDAQKNPIVVGTGFGLRSRLFGYYVRADWAWGIEDGVVLPSIFYVSLSTDF